MRKKLFISLLSVMLITAGCASKWTMKTDAPQAELIWPSPPNKPWIKHVLSIKGFSEESSRLKALIYGIEDILLQKPVAAAAAKDGRLAIADTDCRCVHFYLPSEQRYLAIVNAKTEELASPVGVAFDDDSRLYVSDSALGKIFVFDKNGNYLFQISRAGDNLLQRPTGLTYSTKEKMLFISDTLANKIYAMDKNGHLLFSFGKRGNMPGEFNFPTHISLAPTEMLYLTDSLNFRVQIFDSKGRFLTSFGHHGNGSGDFAMPKGIAVDKDNVIYVADALMGNVQLFDKKGRLLLIVGSQGTADGEFWMPSGLFIADRKLYVCDSFNQRVQLFEIIGELDDEKKI